MIAFRAVTQLMAATKWRYGGTRSVASESGLLLTATTERGPPHHLKTRAQNAHKLRRMGLYAVLVLLAVAPSAGSAETSKAAQGTWLTGSALAKRLSAPMDIVWSGKSFRAALESLSQAENIAIVLDRRIDPDAPVDVAISGKSLAEALAAIAQHQKAAVCMVGPVAYFGPPEAARRLRTLVWLRSEEVKALPAEAAKVWTRSRPFTWPNLAEPRQLLAQLARDSNIELKGLELVPHDLWAAADLPPLSLAERLSLVAIQFELTFTIAPDGKTVTLVPIPDDVAIVRSYDGGRQPEALAKRYASLAPEARISVSGGKVWVKGLLEDHERITSPPVKPPEASQPRDIELVRIERLAIKNIPLGKALENIAAKLELELHIDRQAIAAAGISLEQPVSVNASGLTVDELLAEMVKSTGLTVQRTGRTVKIAPSVRKSQP